MNYSIGEFSKITDLSAPTLRYYEQEQLIVVSRDSSGRRYYTEKDIDWILFIKKLKDTGMPINAIREYAVLRYQGDSTMQRRLEILKNHKIRVIREKAKWDINLQNLEEKIKVYQQRLSNERL
jgi:DNA-binding transcriptional MerR regulator